MSSKDRDPTESGARRRKTGDRETGRGGGPEDPTAAWDPDRTLPAPAPAEPAPPSGREAGETFGSYHLETRLGRGGFGEVWEAVHTESGRRVALKLLTAKGETTPEARERFHREARLAASVSHPHCVFLFGAEEVDGRMAVAMELMEGGTLQELLDAEGRLPYRRAVDMVLDLVDGLEAAHDKGIIHRDIKPSNCFLDGSGGVKVGDFGLSKTLEAEEALTVTGTYLGTPAYSSPEQVRGREIDFRSDVFSLGAVLYHLVTGERPFGSGPATHVLGRILFEDPKPPSEHGVEVPKGLEKVIRRMMAKEPDRRFRSYEELRRALLPFGSQALSPATLPKRLGAYLLDISLFSIPSFFLGVMLGLQEAEAEWVRQPTAQALFTTVPLLYFFTLESLWGSSLGKRLVGLRIHSADGSEAGWGQVLVRTATFVGVPFLVSLPLTQNVLMHDLVGWATLAVILATMRKRNGYAGVHELLSDTRVTARPSTRRRTTEDEAQTAPEGMGLDAGELQLGPYLATRRLWKRRGEELYEAVDPLLERRVWLYVTDGPIGARKAPWPRAQGDTHPAHLQWLQGGRADGRRWNAYEAPDGSPLIATTTEEPIIEWADALVILQDLAHALAGDPGAREDKSLAHVWLEPGGRVRLLPFAWPNPVEGDEAPAADRRAPEGLVHGATILLLEGRIPRSSGESVARPLPRTARTVLERIASGRYSSAEEIAESLEDLQRRPPRVSRLRRAGALTPALLLMAFLFGPFALGIFFAIRDNPLSERRELPERLAQWHSLEGQTGAGVERRREALAGLLAQGYLDAKAERDEEDPEQERETPGGSGSSLRELSHDAFVFLITGKTSTNTGPPGLPDGISEEDEQLLAELARGKERLEPEEVTKLYRIAGPTRTNLWLALSWFCVPAFFLAAGAILSAALSRGGLGLRLAGIHVQRSDGRPAGRGRCALRALAAWAPAVLTYIVGLYLLGLGHPVTAVLAVGGPVLLLAGALYAVWHPTRGFQDRLAGTWLIPR